MQEILTQEYASFVENLKQRVLDAQYKAARLVNRELILLYHHIGTQILKSQQEYGWGAKIIDRLSKDLRSAFPDMKGFSTRNLLYMRKFAVEYPNIEFVQQVAAQLPWFHTVTLIDKISDKQERLFYMESAMSYGWSRAILIHQIESNLHMRQGQAVSNFEEKLPFPQSDLARQTLKDPYLFDFLSLGNEINEREIEKSLVEHMEKFLLELGKGFSFVQNQRSGIGRICIARC